MILLEQVSTAPLLRYASYGYFLDKKIIKKEQEEIQARCYELLRDYNITNYQQLKDLIESGNPEFDILFLKKHLLSVEKNLGKLNIQGKEAKVYPCNDYSNVNYDRDTLTLTDNTTMGNFLLFGNPLIKVLLREKLGEYSISDIKRLLNQVSVIYTHGNTRNGGQNAFIYDSFLHGVQAAEKIREMIHFYEEQVVRQAYETNLKGVNLFDINKDKKSIIIEEQINEIIEYLLDNAEVCVWGPLSVTSRDLLFKVLKNSKSIKVVNAKYGLIDALSDYTTLSEAEEGLVRKRTIDRFIVK